MVNPNLQPTRTPMAEQAPELRSRNFKEVALGYTPKEAVQEARRCLQCKKPACVTGCPVGIPIPQFLAKVAEEDFAGAFAILSAANALPRISGRVCPQETQCEGKCIRGLKQEPVAIGRVERFVADWAAENHLEGAPAQPGNGHKAAIIGSGPAGLTCAGELARKGCAVTVFEAFHLPGGVLSYGIPEFRLPKAIVRQEVEDLKKLGVDFETDMVIGKVLTIPELFQRGYETVFIASGAGLPQFMKIPGEGLVGVYSANEYLTRINLMKAWDPPQQHPGAPRPKSCRHRRRQCGHGCGPLCPETGGRGPYRLPAGRSGTTGAKRRDPPCPGGRDPVQSPYVPHLHPGRWKGTGIRAGLPKDGTGGTRCLGTPAAGPHSGQYL